MLKWLCLSSLPAPSCRRTIDIYHLIWPRRSGRGGRKSCSADDYLRGEIINTSLYNHMIPPCHLRPLTLLLIDWLMVIYILWKKIHLGSFMPCPCFNLIHAKKIQNGLWWQRIPFRNISKLKFKTWPYFCTYKVTGSMCLGQY